MHTVFYSYTSTSADWDPVKTIFLCPPAACCKTLADAEAFAIRSGWQAAAEANKCLLVVPLAETGWEALPEDHLMSLYQQFRNSVPGKQGRTIWGRGGTLWCWETILFAVGYEDGAEYVSRVQVAYPSFLAASALVGGATVDVSAGQRLSTHWLVPGASADYRKRNCEIPSQVWIYTEHADCCQTLIRYWNGVNQADACAEETVGGLTCRVHYAKHNPAHQVRVFPGSFGSQPALAEHILRNCFSHVIRWKNGPDGTLALVPSREEFYNDPRNLRRSVGLAGNYYDYFIHLPAGKTPESVKNLPLVVSVHGRGEPVWMYSGKNGWEQLSDETGDFVTLTPDSPGNIWFRERDAEAFPRMIAQALEEFGLDPQRVYLTGFSNGGMMTRELSLMYPHLFAAVSPWNGPGIDTAAMTGKDTSRHPNAVLPQLGALAQRLVEERWEMPVFMYYGDSDMGIGLNTNLLLPTYLEANGCSLLQDEACPAGYRPDEEYMEQYGSLPGGDRFRTFAYRGGNGQIMVCVTLMKNMPHGAISSQSRVAWEFLRHFRRLPDRKTIIFE